MSATVEVPPALNMILREALIEGIGDVAEALTDQLKLRDRVRHPDRFDAPFDRLARIRALLADLGWGDADPDQAVCEKWSGVFPPPTATWALEKLPWPSFNGVAPSGTPFPIRQSHVGPLQAERLAVVPSHVRQLA